MLGAGDEESHMHESLYSGEDHDDSESCTSMKAISMWVIVLTHKIMIAFYRYYRESEQALGSWSTWFLCSNALLVILALTTHGEQQKCNNCSLVL